MAAVNTCGRNLGIRQGTVIVLDALLSCLPCQGADGREAPVTPATLLTIYASNETLCFRARGLTDRQLRRHLESLEKTGLIRRRDSANGKRFPVMQHGKAIGAFGIDLSPLFVQAEALLAMARRCREEAAELRGLRAQILRLRAACADLQLDEKVSAFVDGLRNLMRRTSLTLCEARAALSQLTTVLARAEPCVTATEGKGADQASEKADNPLTCKEKTDGVPPHNPVTVLQSDPAGRLVSTDQTPACAGQNDRHIEHESDTKKRKAPREALPEWARLTEISAFYAEPDTPQEARRIAFEFGKLLRISQDILASAASRLGLWDLLRLEDRMAKQIGGILNPDAYIRRVLRS